MSNPYSPRPDKWAIRENHYRAQRRNRAKTRTHHTPPPIIRTCPAPDCRTQIKNPTSPWCARHKPHRPQCAKGHPWTVETTYWQNRHGNQKRRCATCAPPINISPDAPGTITNPINIKTAVSAKPLPTFIAIPEYDEPPITYDAEMELQLIATGAIKSAIIRDLGSNRVKPCLNCGFIASEYVFDLLTRDITYSEIAKITGYSISRIRQLAKKRGFKRAPRREFTEQEISLAEALLDDGASHGEVARKLGRHQAVISRRWPGRGWTSEQAKDLRE